MELKTKETNVAGVIGGVTIFSLAFLFMTFLMGTIGCKCCCVLYDCICCMFQ